MNLKGLKSICRHNYYVKDLRNIVFMILMQDFDNTEELSLKTLKHKYSVTKFISILSTI